MSLRGLTEIDYGFVTDLILPTGETQDGSEKAKKPYYGKPKKKAIFSTDVQGTIFDFFLYQIFSLVSSWSDRRATSCGER
jgi:hypothetical protein